MEKKNEMLVNRATGLKRVPIDRPARKGKTAKDKAKKNRIVSSSRYIPLSHPLARGSTVNAMLAA